MPAEPYRIWVKSEDPWDETWAFKAGMFTLEVSENSDGGWLWYVWTDHAERGDHSGDPWMESDGDFETDERAKHACMEAFTNMLREAAWVVQSSGLYHTGWPRT